MIKKNLPNIIFLVLMVGGSGLLIFLYNCFGLGLFLKAFGVVMLVAGIFVFIFFLSIDPGYGWSKNVNFNANYLAISAAVITCLAGVGLLFLGREIHVTAIQEKGEMSRCQEIRNGQVEDALGKEWYFLSDRKDHQDLSLFLFQKRGEAKSFKVVAIEALKSKSKKISEIRASAVFDNNPVVVKARDGVCSGIFEGDILVHSSGDINTGANTDATVGFDVLVAYGENGTENGISAQRQEHILLESEFCLR